MTDDETNLTGATSQTGSTPRRGRPRTGEREERRERVIEAAFAELTESGFEGVTMLKIAKRAGASKETLYSWFGNRTGLFTAMIEENGERAAERVRLALDGDADPIETLTDFCEGLLRLLTSDQSTALNHAAMNSPELAKILLASGRHRVGPIVEEYLATLATRGSIQIESPADAFTLLYGLAIRDTQIRTLLGEEPPDPDAMAHRAAIAVGAFWRLVDGTSD